MISQLTAGECSGSQWTETAPEYPGGLQGSYTFVSLNSRLESNTEEEGSVNVEAQKLSRDGSVSSTPHTKLYTLHSTPHTLHPSP